MGPEPRAASERAGGTDASRGVRRCSGPGLPVVPRAVVANGSKRKVRKVYDELRSQGVSSESLNQVRAPLGIDIGADSPEEIAISVMAEVLAVLRKRSGKSMRLVDRVD